VQFLACTSAVGKTETAKADMFNGERRLKLGGMVILFGSRA
jgi:hypothetical protein